MRYALVFVASLLLACGGSSSATDAGPDAGPDAAVDCSTVGIGAPARCELGCQAACGCGSCGEGEIWDFGGQHRICIGGCLALIVDAGPTDAATDAGMDAAVDAGMDAATDAAIDAATDASVDAATDAATDAGPADSGPLDASSSDSGLADSGAAG